MQSISMLGLVRRLLANEAGESQDRERQLEAAEQMCDKLGVHLSKRIGPEGFRTLLARAVTLATTDFPLLSAVTVHSDGSLVGLRMATVPGPQGREAQQEDVEGIAAIVTRFLELLATFIGEDLTLRMLKAVWPEFLLDDAIDWKDERS